MTGSGYGGGWGQGYTGYGSGSQPPVIAQTGTGTSPQDLINQYQQAYDQAKKANETRYNEILGGYRSRRDRALSDLAGSGDQERKDIAQEASNFEGRMGQDAVSRGLAGTSVLPAGKLAAAKFKTDATGRLDERLRQQRISLDSGLDQDTLQFMERRNDTYPDFEMLAKLSQGMGGASGGGMGMQVFSGGYGSLSGDKRDKYTKSKARDLYSGGYDAQGKGVGTNLSSGGVDPSLRAFYEKIEKDYNYDGSAEQMAKDNFKMPTYQEIQQEARKTQALNNAKLNPQKLRPSMPNTSNMFSW